LHLWERREILVGLGWGNPKAIGRPRLRWEDNAKGDMKEIGKCGQSLFESG
jgi:hypothetical protein